MKYLNSLNHYRALSIILIVTIHSQFVADIKLESYTSKFLFNAISGSTLNFVFISGFLFYLVFYKNYKYQSFLRGRVNRFLKPYMFLSILPILVCLVTIPQYWDNSRFVEFNNDSFGLWYFISSFKYLITGAHITAYWYIPFMMIMVLMSPLHIKFIKLKLVQQLAVFFVLLIFAAFIQRPFERTNLFQAIQSVIYFTPLYLMGIICALYKDKIYKLLKGKEIYILAIIILFVAIQTSLGSVGLYKNDFLVYNGIGLTIFKMVFVCLFFMVWLQRFENVRNRAIDGLAKASFTIYFLHVYVLKLITIIKAHFNLSFENYSILAYITITFVLIIFSMLVAKVMNKLLPNYSFVLIGYGRKPSKASKDNNLANVIVSKIEV